MAEVLFQKEAKEIFNKYRVLLTMQTAHQSVQTEQILHLLCTYFSCLFGTDQHSQMLQFQPFDKGNIVVSTVG